MPLDDEFEDEGDGSDDLDSPIFTQSDLELYLLENGIEGGALDFSLLADFTRPDEIRGRPFPDMEQAINYLLETTMITFSTLLYDEFSGLFFAAIPENTP